VALDLPIRRLDCSLDEDIDVLFESTLAGFQLSCHSLQTKTFSIRKHYNGSAPAGSGRPGG